MRVRLTDKGMETLKDARVYDEFRIGRPSFEVESYGDCFLHRLTGSMFLEYEVEPVPEEG